MPAEPADHTLLLLLLLLLLLPPPAPPVALPLAPAFFARALLLMVPLDQPSR